MLDRRMTKYLGLWHSGTLALTPDVVPGSKTPSSSLDTEVREVRRPWPSPSGRNRRIREHGKENVKRRHHHRENQ